MLLLLENKNYVQGKMDVPVLHDISLSIEEGEYVAIMGPSGSGKSTLMNIIGCLDKPTSGSYILDGTEVANMKDKELSKVRNKSIGFVFQNFNLLPRQSALQNVELPLQYAKVPRRERRPKCVDALTSVDLQDRMSFKPTQLSGGQKQRVAIARAMVNSPKILLADEPTGALDSKSGIQVMGLFEKLHNEGVTIIMITHAREIAEYADRIITIFDGRITKDEKNLNKVVADYKTDENAAAAGGSDAKTPEDTAGITEENVSAAAEAALYDEGVSEEASFSNASDRLMSILNEESEGDEE